MTAPAPLPLHLPSRCAGYVRCVRCRRWLPLHEEADERGELTGERPAWAVCCDLLVMVAPDGEPRIEDMGLEEDQP